MTKILYDALYPAGIPADIAADALVASYVDHPEVVPPCMTQLAARFPNNVNVSISAHGHLAQIYDCEFGAIDPAAIPHLISVNYALHLPAVVYCAPRTRPAIEAALAANNTPDPWWWCVQRAGAPFIPDGWDGNQWLGAGPYDQSIISDQLALILTGGGHTPSGTGTIITPPKETDMKSMIVTYNDAQWVVDPDLTGRVHIVSPADFTNLIATGNYVQTTLSAEQMAATPIVTAVAAAG